MVRASDGTSAESPDITANADVVAARAAGDGAPRRVLRADHTATDLDTDLDAEAGTAYVAFRDG
ncbi:hypothetical protein AB0C76_19725 [Kitasatospora sp. NPDC048722]|uniref:hypothetical protein n=1 Tax=Kitasatospora sp. NPDC048722 TaxID=3155639 RepID=UPI00340A9DD7